MARKRKITDSLIAGQTGKVSDKLRSLLDGSVSSSFVKTFGDGNGRYESSAMAKLFKKTKVKERFFSPFKRFFALSVENSVFCTLYRRAVSALLTAPTNTIAVFFLVFGLFCNVTLAARAFLIVPSSVKNSDFLTPLAVVALSLILLFCRESLSGKLAGSRFFSFFLIDILMLDAVVDYEKNKKNDEKAVAGKTIDKEKDDEENNKKFSTLISVILGIAAGAAALFTSPEQVLIFLAAAAGVAAVMYSPECGLALVLLLFPFVSEDILAFCSAVMLASYFLKLFRGKRNISFNGTDIALTALGIFLSFFFKGGYAFAAFAVFITASNTVRSKQILNGCINALSFGFFVCMVYGAAELVINFLAGYIENDALTVQSIVSVFGESASFIVYAVCVMPFFIFRTKDVRTLRLAGDVNLLLLIVACVISGVSSALPMLLMCLALYFVVSTGRIFEGSAAAVAAYLIALEFIDFDNTIGSVVARNVGYIGERINNSGEFLLGSRDHGALPDGAGGYSAIFVNGGAVLTLIIVVCLFLVLCRVLSHLAEANNRSVYSLCLVPLMAFFVFSVQFNAFDSGLVVVLAFSVSIARTGKTFAGNKKDALVYS